MYEYTALVVDVIDGDTLDLAVDLGFRITIVERVRLAGVDTPEKGQPGHDEAAQALMSLVYGATVTAHTAKPHEKYGRWLAKLTTVASQIDVAQWLIDQGFGKPYDGGKKS
jgi:endonuclease YncB( thermonuclease family)